MVTGATIFLTRFSFSWPQDHATENANEDKPYVSG
jgi:hypothetical protein